MVGEADARMGWGGEEQAVAGWRKGPWTPVEDKLLYQYIALHGEGRWSSVASCAGLNRSGKSCRLRWVNYLRPGLKRGRITPQEEAIIIELHALWGNKWSTIARYLPGRTDNEIKNYWRTHFKKKSASPRQHKIIRNSSHAQHLNPQAPHTDIKPPAAFTDPAAALEEQCVPTMSSDATAVASLSTADFWDALWNMDPLTSPGL